MSPAKPNRPHRANPHPAAPLTPYGNRPMVTPIVHAVNYEYLNFEVLRQITDGDFMATHWLVSFALLAHGVLGGGHGNAG